ncbi:MAG TPA: DUF2207 domain-containing protein [Bacillota bacterium]|nr:DUF2207 domain-containing protein [Bacillota bacterium]
MKTRRMLAKLAISLVALLLFTSMVPTIKARGADVDYTISSYESDLTLASDGSAYFQERITYSLRADTVILDKPLPMLDVSDIEDLEVLLVRDEGEETETRVALEARDNKNGDASRTYIYEPIEKDENLYNISIEADKNDGSKLTYIYKYRLKDIVFLYRDTAALFWQFIIPGNTVAHDYVKVSVAYPKGKGPEVEGYIGGSVYDEKAIDDDGRFAAQASKIGTDQSFELVLLMPVDIFPDGRKLIDNNAKSDIVEEMTMWEQEVLDLHKQANKKRVLMGAFIGLLILVIGFISFCILNKYKKKKNRDINSESGIQDRAVH